MRILSFFLLLISAPLFPQKGNLMWFDATANFERLSYPDSIDYYFTRVKQLGFTDVVIDLKPITGETLYPSQFAAKMNSWQGFQRDSSFAFLEYCISSAHKLNLKIHASINVFVAGHNYFDRGPVYTNKAHWQSINYTDSVLVPISSLKHKYSAMTNPALPEVREHELSIIAELVANYPLLDGIILDRVRYDGIEADFSEYSRTAFEKFAGLTVENFPDDIYTYSKNTEGKSIRTPGKFYKKWLEWRASVVHSFFKEARGIVKKISPSILFGDYTGAWYPLYYEVGVNWASDKYDPSAEYEWATPEYKNFGYASLLDLYTTGCYFFEVTKDEVSKLNEENIKRGEAAMGNTKEYWYSVEGSAEIAMKVIKGDVPVIGGLYVEQYKGFPEQFIRAMRMCRSKTDGLMIFDIVHIINYGWWDVLAEGMNP